MGWLEFMAGITKTFWQDAGFASLFVIALVVILRLEKEKIKRYIFLWYTGLVLVFIYNPITLLLCKLVLEESTFEQYYLRFYSIIPIIAIIAYGFTLAVNRLSGVRKLLAVLAGIAVIGILGNCIYSEDWVTKSTNRNKVPQDVVTICDIFKDDTSRQIRIMAPVDIAVYLRQMDARFSMPYSRYMDGDAGMELTNPTPNPQIVADYCQEHDVEYVVVSAVDSILNTYLNYGFELVGRTPYFGILRVVNPVWFLTEYPDASGDQGLCYTLHNSQDGTLIVIDGGDAANAQTVRDAINANGGVVDAWILTHYHQDHIDAFNEVYADLGDITVREIYVTPLDAEKFYGIAQEWDDVDSFDRFHELTADADNINLVSRDDVLTFSDGLEITFLNAYDEVVINNAEDIPNNDSLVMRIETANRSALICSDCHSRGMGEYLVSHYGEQLDVDILQCAHHGNNSIPVDTGFYQAVSPEIAIFDAPQWLMLSPEYTAGALAAELVEMGIRIVSYGEQPNVFGLY